MGLIGGRLADMLLCGEDFELLAVSRTYKTAIERTNLSKTIAFNLGYQPNITAVQCDVSNVDAAASLIANTSPDLIINTMSLQTFWKISLLPKEIYSRLCKAKIGPWLPNHLATAYSLMKAIKETGLNIKVVNASFPDAVNPCLASIELSPIIGAGNIGNIVPSLVRSAAKILKIDENTLKLRFSAHHVACNELSSNGTSGEAPTLIKMFVDGEDVTENLSLEELFSSLVKGYKRTRGIEGQFVAASSTAMTAKAMLDPTPTQIHAPGPNGLPGGYPVVIANGEVRVDQSAFKLTQALEVNREGQIIEGISEITSSGEVIFEAREMDVLKKELNYNCERMKVNEVLYWADELQNKYEEFQVKIGLPYDT